MLPRQTEADADRDLDQDLTVSKSQAVKNNVYPSVPLPVERGNGGCLTYYVNTLIPKKAPHAQEARDFLVWTNDPNNKAFMQTVLTYHGIRSSSLLSLT